MAKPNLSPEFHKIEGAIIDVLLAGHHAWRPDLPYPESRSDMQGAVRELLARFDVIPLDERRNIPTEYDEKGS